MKRIYKDRLLKLAKHLESGKLGHKVFDMGVYNLNATRENPCGTAGCAVGECPIVFPRSWKFRYDGLSIEPLLNNYFSIERGGRKFFGLTENEYTDLFFNSSSTPQQEAKVIRDFVKSKKGE